MNQIEPLCPFAAVVVDAREVHPILPAAPVPSRPAPQRDEALA